MIRKLFTLLAVMMAFASPSMANDGIYYTSGNQLVPLRETDIAVKKEVLTIDITDGKYAIVDVYYEFLNPGSKAKTVLMGFEAAPPYNAEQTFSDSGIHPYISNFSVEINGQPMNHRNAIAQMDTTFVPLNAKEWKYDEESMISLVRKNNSEVHLDDYAYVYYFDATFQPGLNKVHHTYKYKMSVVVGTSFVVDYKLSPAGRWANHRIDDFTLIIQSNAPRHFVVNESALPGMQPVVTGGKYKIRENHSYYADEMHWEVAMTKGKMTFHGNNFVPPTDTELSVTSADMLYSYSPNNQLGAYYDRNNTMGLYTYFYQDSEQRMPDSMVMRIAKNLPYAHRGHVFKDAKLKKYFESLFWYMPDESYKDDTSDFTESDWEYIKFDAKQLKE